MGLIFVKYLYISIKLITMGHLTSSNILILGMKYALGLIMWNDVLLFTHRLYIKYRCSFRA